MKNQQINPLIKKQPVLVLGLAVFILIISGGYFYYRYEKKIIRQEQYSNLKTIADLKINQILDWRTDRLADAQVISEGSFIRHNFQRWLLSQDSTLGKNLLERFYLLRYNYKYEDVFVVSAGGKLLLDLNATLIQIDSETLDYCKKALQDKKAFLSDFYFSPAHDTIHIDVFAPIINDRNVAVAVLVLRVNPYDYLYPLIQSWPTFSKSAGTLIIRRDGDSILYLNELRHISSSALRLRIPLTRTEVPAVQAAIGHKGIYEGIDYRGVKVLADMRPVPGTPWFMIAKVDQSEIFSELRYRTVIVIIITLLLLLFFGIGISWLYNIRQKNIYRKLVESGAALEESEVQYRSLFENAEIGMYRSKMDGSEFLDVNTKFAKITGFAREELLGTAGRIRWADPEDRDRMMILLREQGGILNNYEARVLDKNGEVRDVLASIILHSNEDYLDGTMIDITDRKRAERSLLLQKRIGDIFLTVQDDEMFNEVLKIILDLMQSPFGVFGYLDGAGALVVPSMTRHIWDKCQVAEKTFIFPKDTWGNSSWPRAIRGKKPNYSNEISVKTPEGHITLIRHISLPILFHGEVIGLFQVANKETDYTDADINTLEAIAEYIAPVLSARLQRQLSVKEIHQLNTELEQRVIERTAKLEAANKELEAFAYSVSHDLRAPLRAVDGFSKFVLEDYANKLDSEGKRLLNLIRSNTQKMDKLITDLLALSRVTRSELNLSVIDMTQMATSMFKESAAPDVTDKISLSVDPLPEAFADPTYMRQVWANLITNAIKFSSKEKKPLIKICGHTGKGFNVYNINDNGVGFNPEYAHKLFGVFQRLHKSDDFEGTGVGLAIIQRIVHRHGGKVWAEGTEGKGATFWFSIPVKKVVSG